MGGAAERGDRSVGEKQSESEQCSCARVCERILRQELQHWSKGDGNWHRKPLHGQASLPNRASQPLGAYCCRILPISESDRSVIPCVPHSGWLVAATVYGATLPGEQVVSLNGRRDARTGYPLNYGYGMRSTGPVQERCFFGRYSNYSRGFREGFLNRKREV